MTVSEVRILNEGGLHARPAGTLVKVASQFKANINIESNGKKANAKSILGVMSLGLVKDSGLKIVTEGEDEKEAATSLVALIERKFVE